MALQEFTDTVFHVVIFHLFWTRIQICSPATPCPPSTKAVCLCWLQRTEYHLHSQTHHTSYFDYQEGMSVGGVFHS